jgi:hypothetical protein
MTLRAGRPPRHQTPRQHRERTPEEVAAHAAGAAVAEEERRRAHCAEFSRAEGTRAVRSAVEVGARGIYPLPQNWPGNAVQSAIDLLLLLIVRTLTLSTRRVVAIYTVATSQQRHPPTMCPSKI